MREGARGAGESMNRPGGNRDDLPTLRVTNISEDAQEQDLRDLFGTFGRVARVYVGRDRETGIGKGFAFISYEDRAHAQKAMEKIARATFWALDCRDVARVDLRMDADGRIYVLEVNPLPGLTPGYSDLVLIAQAVGMEYDQLIAEIMQGGLRRMREKRREERVFRWEGEG